MSKTMPLENFRLKKTGFRSMAILPLETSRTLSGRADTIEHPPQLNNGTEAASLSSSTSTATVIPPAQVLCTFMDGGVGIYDLSKRHWNFLRELVHVAHILSTPRWGFHRDAPDGIFWNLFGTTFCRISGEISSWNQIVYWYTFHSPYFQIIAMRKFIFTCLAYRNIIIFIQISTKNCQVLLGFLFSFILFLLNFTRCLQTVIC